MISRGNQVKNSLNFPAIQEIRLYINREKEIKKSFYLTVSFFFSKSATLVFSTDNFFKIEKKNIKYSRDFKYLKNILVHTFQRFEKKFTFW